MIDAALRHGDGNIRRDLGLFAGVECVVDQFLENTNGHSVNVVAGLVDQFTASAELHQPRHHERDALQSLLPLSHGRFWLFGLATICKIWAGMADFEPAKSGSVGASGPSMTLRSSAFRGSGPSGPSWHPRTV